MIGELVRLGQALYYNSEISFASGCYITSWARIFPDRFVSLARENLIETAPKSV